MQDLSWCSWDTCVVQCDHCNLWLHVKCNKINPQTYKFLQKSPVARYCMNCFEEIILDSTVSNEELCQTNQSKTIKFKAIPKKVPSNQDLIR